MTYRIIVGIVADYLGILSFGVSLIVLGFSKSIKQKVQEFNEFYNFSIDKSVLKEEFESLINYDGKNGIYRVDSKTLSQINKSLRKLENYEQFMSASDKQAVSKIQTLIASPPLTDVQKDELINTLHKIIGFLELDHRTQYNK
ncbi:hypothetical protein MKZ24_09720 [Paenibacillus sp. FSL R7-0297]|uniref:hypothetical protein n=1 Tax=Paenibacillus sp. FSL R7-0297 TaxID=2921680 RepID=UPI0030F602A8